MLVLQRRFTTTKGVRAAKLMEHKRFRAAYDFLVLRSRCGEVEPALADFWTGAQQGDAGTATAVFETDQPRRKRRRRSRRGGRRGPSDS
jgi:poly(A) polymerase